MTHERGGLPLDFIPQLGKQPAPTRHRCPAPWNMNVQQCMQTLDIHQDRSHQGETPEGPNGGPHEQVGLAVTKTLQGIDNTGNSLYLRQTLG